jgi:hypothetical protein
LNNAVKTIVAVANIGKPTEVKVQSSTHPESGVGSPTKERRIMASVSNENSESLSIEQDSNHIFDDEVQLVDIPVNREVEGGVAPVGPGASVPKALAMHDFVLRGAQNGSN